jgi:Phosphotransferase enzyme family
VICRSYALVPDARGDRLLLLRGEHGWEIPHHEYDGPRWWHVVRDVNEAFSERLGLELTTLRCLAAGGDERRRLRFYELELHGGEAPSAGGWISRDELETIELAEPEHRPMLLRCLDERDVDGGELAVRWARPGWFAEAVAWIRGHVGETAEIVQERTWSISMVVQASTPQGAFYFKAVPRFFAGEPALTRELARRHPGSVPAVAAVDETRGWMLMHAFRGDELHADADLAGAARAYADLQLAWVGRGEELVALGCPDRSLDALEPEIEPLLRDRELLLPGHPDGLSAAELERVPELMTRLHDACDRLRAHGLPPTLEHGDLHTDNVRRVQGRFLFFDWSDASRTVPFFGLVPFLEFHDEPLEETLRARIREAYLEPWAAHLGRDDLVEAFEVAHFVGLFHQAVSYHRITEGTEPRARWEWERGFPFFVKRLLRSLR